MKFEYDQKKSQSNQLKHMINFSEAQRIWDDPRRIEFRLKHVCGEQRHQTIARIDDLIWTAIITYRNDAIRIISVRRARKQEIALYENS